MTEVIYQVQAGPYWDWRVALDLFLGGAGVGALLFAVVLDEIYPGRYRRICHTASCLAPVLVLSGLVLLLLKMGRPQRLILTYLNFNPSSPLWWGGIFQPLLVVGALAYAARWYRADEEDAFRRWLGRLLAPLALIVGAYHGLLLSLLQARPLWNTGPTVVSALLGFAATGIAAVMLVHLIRMKLKGRLVEGEPLNRFLRDMRCVRDALVAILVLQMGTFFLWWLSLVYGSLQDQQALASAREAHGATFWLMGIGVGLVLPLMVGAFTVLRRNQDDRRLQILAISLTSIMILVGGFFFRLTLVLGGQVDLPVQGL